MSLKGLIEEGHIPVNKYALQFLDSPRLRITKVSGLETELETVEMPDRTVHSSGQTKATEITIEIPMHLVPERQYMNAWFLSCQDPVLPNYKKSGTLEHYSVAVDGAAKTSVYALSGVFVKMFKTPEMDMTNTSDAAVLEWTLSVDDVTPLT